MDYTRSQALRGLSHVAGSVCASCFTDPGITAYIDANAAESRCDFCSEHSGSAAFAAPLDLVVDYMAQCILREYEDPASNVGTASHDYDHDLASIMQTDGLLSELDLPHDTGGVLFETLCDALGGRARKWRLIYPGGAQWAQRYNSNWYRFSSLVKHSRRFFFNTEQDFSEDYELMSPQQLLSEIAHLCHSHDLVDNLPSGSRLYRVRKQPVGQTLRSPLQLGPPPKNLAHLPTRMSPAGIPMFYGADNPETALRETQDGPGTYATACFEVTMNLLILDFTGLPRVPSLFDPLRDVSDPYGLSFLHQFTREVMAPIDRQDRAHVDYVPTQVVAEYFRCFELSRGRRVDGIRYRSAQHPPNACYALFAEQEQVVLSTEEIRMLIADRRELEVSLHRDAWLRLITVFEQVAA